MNSIILQLLGYLRTAGVFMLMITVLVAFHELGHYLVARWLGMKVESFSVMLGGIRKTDLTPHLEKPLAPKQQVWAAFFLGFAMVLLGAPVSPIIVNTGLAILAIGVPIWVVSRLCALYHLPFQSGLSNLAMAWGLALAALAFSTHLQGFSPVAVLGVMFCASCIALLLLYYRPVTTVEESSHGHGEILANGNSVAVRYRPVWFRTDRNGTEFSLNALPLGGFVSVAGSQPQPDGSETKVENGFYAKEPWARFLMVAAGPAFSLLLGFLILTPVLMTNGQPSEKPIIGKLMEGKPAARAGLLPGDQILSIDGHPVPSFDRMREYVSKMAGKPVRIDYSRNGTQHEVTLVPISAAQIVPALKDDPAAQRGVIGITPQFEPLPFGKAVKGAASFPLTIVDNLASMVHKPSTVADNVGGPASIIQETDNAAKDGLSTVFGLAGLLSYSLGIMNLLPVPPLDGGQMLLALLEIIKGKRLSLSFQRAASTIGVVVVLCLMGTAIFLDLGRMFGGK